MLNAPPRTSAVLKRGGAAMGTARCAEGRGRLRVDPLRALAMGLDVGPLLGYACGMRRRAGRGPMRATRGAPRDLTGTLFPFGNKSGRAAKTKALRRNDLRSGKPCAMYPVARPSYVGRGRGESGP